MKMNLIRQFEFFSACVVLHILERTYSQTYDPDDYGLDRRKPKCVPLGENFCHRVPYNMTVFPNRFGHRDFASARDEFYDFKPLIEIRCSPLLEQFLCIAYAPPCTQLKSPISACRSYCEEAVTEKCLNILRQFNQTIQPPALDCNNYPKSDTTLCIQPNNTVSQNGGHIGGGNGNPVTWDIFSTFNYDEDFVASAESSQEIDLDLDLLVTSGNKIQLLNIMSLSSMDTITLYRRLPKFLSTTIDYFYQANSYIYWAAETEQRIFRGTMDLDTLKDIRPIVDTGSATVESIVVDWNLKVLFWTESVPIPRLRTSSLSGRGVTTVMSSGMKNPIKLTIDPTVGKLFWIDRQGDDPFEQTPSIHCYSIVTEKHANILNISSLMVVNSGRPTALATDYLEKRLYYVDARSQSLHSLNYDGSDHKVILRDHYLLREPDSLAVHNDHVIWTDKMSNSLIRVDKQTGEDTLVIKTFDSGVPQSIKVYGAKDASTIKPAYQKSSLAEKWLQLSSAENMKDVDIEDYDYDADDDDDDDDDKNGSSAKNIYPEFKTFICLFFCYLCLYVLGL